MLFKKKNKKVIKTSRSIYEKIICQSRNKKFYSDLGVPDTLDGRFELIILHYYFIYSILKTKKEEHILEEISKIMFKDFDMSLREMGVGDLSVGKKIYFMNEALAGRINAYKISFKEGEKSIYKALRRNVFGTLKDVKEYKIKIMVTYFKDSLNTLNINNFIEITEKDDIFLSLDKYI